MHEPMLNARETEGADIYSDYDAALQEARNRQISFTADRQPISYVIDDDLLESNPDIPRRSSSINNPNNSNNPNRYHYDYIAIRKQNSQAKMGDAGSYDGGRSLRPEL